MWHFKLFNPDRAIFVSFFFTEAARSTFDQPKTKVICVWFTLKKEIYEQREKTPSPLACFRKTKAITWLLSSVIRKRSISSSLAYFVFMMRWSRQSVAPFNNLLSHDPLRFRHPSPVHRKDFCKIAKYAKLTNLLGCLRSKLQNWLTFMFLLSVARELKTRREGRCYELIRWLMNCGTATLN